jgi:8-oxo-dGTP pyrophosphatase MutT (NUDIX family)
VTSGFRRLGEDRLFEGHLFSVSRVRLSDPDGGEFSREIVEHPGAVAIVPVHDDGTVTLVRQMRPAVGETVLEAPAGTCDVDGESLEETARRELAEEAGLRARRITRLAAVYNSPGYTTQVTTIFLATGLEPCETGRAGVEERWMSVETLPLDATERLVADGRLLDSTTIVGLFLARGAVASTDGPGAR